MAFSLLSLIIILVPITFILIIAAIAVSIRSQSRKGNSQNDPNGGKNMIKTVYTYLICFATLMMTIGGSVAAFMALADLVAPPAYYMSFQDYKINQKAMYEIDPQTNQPIQEKSEDQLLQEYEGIVEGEKKRSQDRALNSLIKSFGWIVIPFPVFIYYQRRLRYES